MIGPHTDKRLIQPSWHARATLCWQTAKRGGGGWEGGKERESERERERERETHTHTHKQTNKKERHRERERTRREGERELEERERERGSDRQIKNRIQGPEGAIHYSTS